MIGGIIGFGVMITIIIVCDIIDANRRFKQIIENATTNN